MSFGSLIRCAACGTAYVPSEPVMGVEYVCDCGVGSYRQNALPVEYPAGDLRGSMLTIVQTDDLAAPPFGIPVGCTLEPKPPAKIERPLDRTVGLFPAASISLRLFSAVRAELAPFKQRQIADVLGITEGRVSQMMGGGQNWTLDTITRLLMAAEKLNRELKS